MNRLLQKGISVLIVIFILAVVLIGGVVVYQQLVSPEEVKTPETEEGQVTNWKTYRNEEYGFEIKYPNTWYVIKSKITNIIIISAFSESTSRETPEEVSIMIFEYRTDITIEKSLDTLQKMKQRILSNPAVEVKKYTIDETIIGDVKGYVNYQEYNFKDRPWQPEGDIIWFFPDKNGQGFFQIIGTFRGENRETYAEISQQILSTFQFLE